MAQYAATTTVPVERSRGEIERLLERYGASAFGYMTDQARASIMFEVHGRRVRFDLPLPQRSEYTAATKFEQAMRSRWRSLVLVIKGKLDAVATGIVTFEDEFLAYVCLPDGSTVGAWATNQLAIVYDNNAMPALMPGAA